MHVTPFFYYACKKLKTRLQTAQYKCIRFCLKLDDRFRLKSKEFERINWLPVQERISQCALCNVYKFFSKHSPDYFEELFFPTEETAIRTRSLKNKHRAKVFIVYWPLFMEQSKRKSEKI